MTSPIVFSSQVIKDIRALPTAQQADVVAALIDTILGHDVNPVLPASSAWAFALLSLSVRRDSERYSRKMAGA